MAAPCIMPLTSGLVVRMTIARLTLLVKVSCAKLPVLEIMAPLEDVVVEEPDPHSSAAETLGPEIAVCAGMVLPSGQVTATPVLHGPTATPVGVGCASTKLTAAAEMTAAMISVRLFMFYFAACWVGRGQRDRRHEVRFSPVKRGISQNQRQGSRVKITGVATKVTAGREMRVVPAVTNDRGWRVCRCRIRDQFLMLEAFVRRSGEPAMELRKSFFENRDCPVFVIIAIGAGRTRRNGTNGCETRAEGKDAARQCRSAAVGAGWAGEERLPNQQD